MQSPLPIPGPLTLGELLDRAIRLYRSHFASFILTAAVLLVPFSILSLLLTGSGMASYFTFLTNLSVPSDVPPEQIFGNMFGSMAGYLGISLLLVLVGLVINALVLLALTSQSIETLHGRPARIGDALRTAVRRFWSYVGMQIVQLMAFFGITLVMMVALLIIFVVLGLGFGGLAMLFGGENGDAPAAMIAMVGVFGLMMCLYLIALVCLAAPYIYLSARWFVATPGLVAQQWDAVGSLRASWRLTKGFVWRCIGFSILLWIFGMVITATPVYLLQWLLMILLPPSALFYGVAISAAVASALGILWQPLSAIALVLLYYDLRVRHEGYDLALRLEQLESELRTPQVATDDIPPAGDVGGSLWTDR
jgi:hypothetical protein